MNRLARLAVAYAAALLQAVAPLVGYAATPMPAGMAGDLCSAVGATAGSPSGPMRAPSPATDPHRCADAACCASAATMAAAPSKALPAPWRVGARFDVAVPAVGRGSPGTAHLAARPRGPPHHS